MVLSGFWRYLISDYTRNAELQNVETELRSPACTRIHFVRGSSAHHRGCFDFSIESSRWSTARSASAVLFRCRWNPSFEASFSGETILRAAAATPLLKCRGIAVPFGLLAKREAGLRCHDPCFPRILPIDQLDVTALTTREINATNAGRKQSPHDSRLPVFRWRPPRSWKALPKRLH